MRFSLTTLMGMNATRWSRNATISYTIARSLNSVSPASCVCSHMGWGADESDILGGINMTETNENRELRTQLQHIADGGYHCPRCGSEELDGGERDSIDDYEYRDFECLDCGFRYTEEYILNGYWPKGDDDPQIGPTLVEHLRQQLREAVQSNPYWDRKRNRWMTFGDIAEMNANQVRCRSGLSSVGSTPLLKVRHKRGAMTTNFGGVEKVGWSFSKTSSPRWDWGKVRTIYALMAQGYTAEEAVAMEKAASKDEEVGGSVLKANTTKDEQGDEE